MSLRETQRHGLKGRIRTSRILFFAARCVVFRPIRCGSVVFQVNFVNQICEVWSGMSDRFPSSVHHIKLIDGRCERVIRFTYVDGATLAGWV